MPATLTLNIDHAALRSALAIARVSKRKLAAECSLSESYLRRILNGDAEPGELAIRKLAEGLNRLGLSELAATALPSLDCLNRAAPSGVAVSTGGRKLRPKAPIRSGKREGRTGLKVKRNKVESVRDFIHVFSPHWKRAIHLVREITRDSITVFWDIIGDLKLSRVLYLILLLLVGKVFELASNSWSWLCDLP